MMLLQTEIQSDIFDTTTNRTLNPDWIAAWQPVNAKLFVVPGWTGSSSVNVNTETDSILHGFTPDQSFSTSLCPSLICKYRPSLDHLTGRSIQELDNRPLTWDCGGSHLGDRPTPITPSALYAEIGGSHRVYRERGIFSSSPARTTP
jgi:hypothetical protein